MKNETPQWLTDIQNNSWEPEIILSGLTITFLFIMDDKMFNFFAMLIQSYDIGVIGIILYIFSVQSFNTMSVLLIFHLLLRGLWVGMIGLSYAYPQGINEDKIPLTFKTYGVDDAHQYVIAIEKICSILFSLIFTIIGTFAFLFLMFFPILAINIWVNNPAWQTPLIQGYIVMVILPLAILPMVLKKQRWAKRFNNNFVNCTINTMISNPGGRVPLILFFVLTILSLLMSSEKIAQFRLLHTDPVKTETQNIVQLKQRHYMESHRISERLLRAAITSKETAADHLELFIAFYQADQQMLENIQNGWQPINKALQAIDPQKGLPALFTLSINDQIIKDAQWAMLDNHQLEQAIYYVRIKIKHLKTGMHRLRIDKLLSTRDSKHYDNLKRWDELVFYKISSNQVK